MLLTVPPDKVLSWEEQRQSPELIPQGVTHMQPQFFENSLYIPFSYQKVTPEVWAGVSMATAELVSRGWKIGVLNCHNSLLPKFNIFFVKHSPTYVLS